MDYGESGIDPTLALKSERRVKCQKSYYNVKSDKCMQNIQTEGYERSREGEIASSREK